MYYIYGNVISLSNYHIATASLLPNAECQPNDIYLHFAVMHIREYPPRKSYFRNTNKRLSNSATKSSTLTL